MITQHRSSPEVAGLAPSTGPIADSAHLLSTPACRLTTPWFHSGFSVLAGRGSGGAAPAGGARGITPRLSLLILWRSSTTAMRSLQGGEVHETKPPRLHVTCVTPEKQGRRGRRHRVGI